MNIHIQQFITIVRKDILVEWRSAYTLAGMIVFAMLLVLLCSFAFTVSAQNRAELAAGTLWIACLFSSMTGIVMTSAQETEEQPLDRLLLCPVHPQVLYLAKVTGNFLLISGVGCSITLISSILFDFTAQIVVVLPIILAGAIGIAVTGTLMTMISNTVAAREFLVPILTVPLLTPVLLGCVSETVALLNRTGTTDPWIGMILAFDVIILATALVLCNYTVTYMS